MKKILKKINSYHFSKYQFLLLLLIPIAVMFTRVISLDNDTWYLLNTGRYIFNHGISKTLVFTIHDGFDMLMQNWGGTLIFYTVYKYFNFFGLFLFIVFLFSIIIYLLFKITYLVSDKKLELSVLITVITTIIFGTMFVVMRTQMFTFIIILLLIYSLELYIKTDNAKYLILLPILSIIQINFHAAFWVILFLICLPYLIDSFNFRIGDISSQGYRKMPLIIAIVLMFIVGFINPYGIDAMIFIFHSVSSEMSNSINELKSLSIHSFEGIMMFSIMAFIYVIYFFIDKNKIRVRYLLLTLGISVLSFYSVRSFSLFLLTSSFSLGYLFKDKCSQFVDKIDDYSDKKRIVHYILSTVVVFIISFIIVINIKCDFSYPMEDNINYILKHYSSKSVKLYINFDNGGYAEFNGLKSYIDPRAEAFLKSNNHKYDVYSEMLMMHTGKIDPKKFLDKYDFTHILIKEDYDYGLDLYLSNADCDYKLVYKDKIGKLYVRKDIEKR